LVVPPHRAPSIRPQFAAPPVGWLHVPKPPFVALQMPPQQSAPVWHASPFCSQKLETAQTPLAHRPEQHSPSPAHALPSVLHSVFSGVHFEFSQVPLQQSLSFTQARLSDVHCGKLHTPEMQSPEQQSPATLHAEPSRVHIPPSPVNGSPPMPVPVDPPAPPTDVPELIDAPPVDPPPACVPPPVCAPVDARLVLASPPAPVT
jgi:hypothetical protein